MEFALNITQQMAYDIDNQLHSKCRCVDICMHGQAIRITV